MKCTWFSVIHSYQGNGTAVLGHQAQHQEDDARQWVWFYILIKIIIPQHAQGLAL